MATVRYTVIDGEVIAEKRAGVRSLYVPDPLGSTVALLDSSQTQTDTFTYWPYGENNARTGTTATPFQFVGTLGAYKSDSRFSYCRARSLGLSMGRWLSPEPRTVGGNLYLYGYNSPLTFVDIDGLMPQRGNEKLSEGRYEKVLDDIAKLREQLSKGGDRRVIDKKIKELNEEKTAHEKATGKKWSRGSSHRKADPIVEDRSYVPLQETAKIATVSIGGGIVVVGIWEVTKWVAAAALAPETGGLSLAGAALIP